MITFIWDDFTPFGNHSAPPHPPYSLIIAEFTTLAAKFLIFPIQPEKEKTFRTHNSSSIKQTCSQHHSSYYFHKSIMSSNAHSNTEQHSSDNHHSNRDRKGRQARSSQLTSSMQNAVRRFCRSVGAPSVVPPAGFRDFRGWLIYLNSRECRSIWDQLISTIARDLSNDVSAINAVAEDVVREIIKCVVIPRPDESAKLVSTNAGRQASRPRTGTTLLTVFEQQVARVAHKLPQLVNDGTSSRFPPSDILIQNSSPVTLTTSPTHISFYSPSSPDWSPPHRYRNSSQVTSRLSGSHRMPSIQDLLSENTPVYRPLPSFRELDASLRKNRSSSSRRR